MSCPIEPGQLTQNRCHDENLWNACGLDWEMWLLPLLELICADQTVVARRSTRHFLQMIAGSVKLYITVSWPCGNIQSRQAKPPWHGADCESTALSIPPSISAIMPAFVLHRKLVLAPSSLCCRLCICCGHGLLGCETGGHPTCRSHFEPLRILFGELERLRH